MEETIMAMKKVKEDLAEKVVDEIEEQNLRKDTSEVEVNEDGYAEDTLLAGYVDDNGMVHKTFLYREMNGRDEEAINKPEVQSNPAKIMNVLAERCVVQIGNISKKEVGTKAWGDIIRSLLGGDIDYIALKIREISKGKEVTFEHKCPRCKTKLTTIVSTDEYKIIPFDGQREVSFELFRGYKDKKGQYHKEGLLRQMTGLDREILIPSFKKNKASGTTLMLTRLMSFEDAVVLPDQVSEMSLRDREYLEKLVNDSAFGLDTSMEITCSNCGEDLSGEVGTTNFF